VDRRGTAAGSRLTDPMTPELPAVARTAPDLVETTDGRRLGLGDRFGPWTAMAVIQPGAANALVVFEDFSTVDGVLAIVGLDGTSRILAKTSEPTSAEPSSLYLGHPLADVLASEHDLLGSELLAQPGDPDFTTVAGCLAPITAMDIHAFLGTARTADKVAVAYGGATSNFDVASFVPAIREIRAGQSVRDGLVGGWLPVLRFVYPEGTATWSELVMYAPDRIELDNPNVAPVWYRVARIEAGELAWVRYVDTYVARPAQEAAAQATSFYRDLILVQGTLDETLSEGMTIDIPDRRLADQARHSLVRAMITRIDGFPKYGVTDRNYGGTEHDGFQDTFTADATAALDWGLSALARGQVDNYLSHFVRDDGSLLYRGPELGQYGRMLTVLAHYANLTGDVDLLLAHRNRIDAITNILIDGWGLARTLPSDHPAFGIIVGWCEADSCIDPAPDRYLQPYISTNAEAARGIGDLAGVWIRAGRDRADTELGARGEQLQAAAAGIDRDLQLAIGRTLRRDLDPPWLPTIAGAEVPYTEAVGRDLLDPQFRAYRANAELLFSGRLSRDQVRTIVDYREAHRDIVLGVPVAYGCGDSPTAVQNAGELAGFLSYGHGYGLLHHDLVREYLLELYALSAHQYTRGSWTAPETRRIDPELPAAPYCVPAQLTVPMLVRWLLVWEEPVHEVLWLCRAAPRDWFDDGCVVAADRAPSRWGRLDFRVESHLDDNQIEVTLDLPATGPDRLVLRLRLPGDRSIRAAQIVGQGRLTIEANAETVTVHQPGGPIRLVVTCLGR
jgi:hypothetical protein